MDYMYLETETYTGFSIYLQYMQCFYNSIILLGGSGIGPRDDTQIINSIIVILMGAIINANIFGNMAVIIQDLNLKASKFQEKIDIANTSMKNMKLDNQIQEKIRNYLFYTQGNQETQRELDDFKTMISPSLKLEVTRHIFLQVLTSSPIFGDNPELIEMIIEKVAVDSKQPEAVVIKQGDSPSGMFILSKGEMAVLVKDEFNKESFVRVLKPGALFGEVALIAECPRTATIQCLNYCTFALLSVEGFKEVCKMFPDFQTKIRLKRCEYKDTWKTFMFNIINTVYYFKNLSPESLEEVFYSLETDYFEKDTVLVEAGDSLDKIWIIVDGEVDINVHMDTGEVVIIETLKRGCHFGQFSCLIEAPQMFQYKARTNVMIQSINTAMLENLRIELSDLNDELANGFIHEYGVPVCDFKVNHIYDEEDNTKRLKERFKDCVRRAFVLNM
jgi:CRP-like cAMP-binding protein